MKLSRIHPVSFQQHDAVRTPLICVVKLASLPSKVSMQVPRRSFMCKCCESDKIIDWGSHFPAQSLALQLKIIYVRR